MADGMKSGKLERDDGETIAYEREIPERPAGRVGLVWLSGFKSDMTGTKAVAVADWARENNHHLLRFDYFAHGASSGDFRDGTIGRWLDDALFAIDSLSEGPLMLIGSSMGGWIALLVALARPDRVKGLTLIAPAPDFTEELMWKGFSDELREVLLEEGVYQIPSEYSEDPYVITLKLIEEGRNHLLLDKDIPLDIPVRILQGMKDSDVPWVHATRLMDALTSNDVTLHLKKHGDHRLSEPEDIEQLLRTIDALLHQLETQ